MATATFGSSGQYTYNVDSKGVPYGAPLPSGTKATTTSSYSTAPKTTTTTSTSSGSSGSSSSGSTSVATTTSQAIKDLQTTLNAQNAGKPGYVPLVVDGIDGPKTQAALALYNSGVKTTPTNVITPETLTPVTPIVVPPIVPPINVADTVVAGAQAQLTQLQAAEAERIKAAQDAVALKNRESSDLSKQISELLGKSGGEGQATMDAEEAAGVPEMKSRLTALNNQIQTKLAEYNALNVDVQGKPITMSSIIGAQAQIKNVAASDIGLLQAQASALQGNLDEAQSTADRAVELKYQDINKQIEIKLNQLQLIQSDLTDAEKVVADALDSKYKEEQSALSVQIANEKDLNATLLNAMQTYPDAKISLTDTIEQANAKIVANSKIYADKVRAPAATVGEKDSAEIQSTMSLFNRSAGSDGYIDPYLYRRIRAESDMTPSQFDERFGYFVNPASYNIVGFKTTSGGDNIGLTSAKIFELQKQGVDIEAYKTDPEYRAAVNSNLE